MKFLVDVCTGPSVASWLRDNGHEVFSVYEDAIGAEDDIILQKAFEKTGF
jgi:predicted nuclease of predicted toxin-antitoxin system